MDAYADYYFYNEFNNYDNTTVYYPIFFPPSSQPEPPPLPPQTPSQSSPSSSLQLTSALPVIEPTTTSVHGPTLLYSTGITILLGSIAALLCIITISGNAIVVLSFFLEQSIRQPTNYFIASLAVSDLFIGAVSMPLYTVYLLADQYWPLSEFLCNVWLTVDYTACLCSIYTVFCITVDRYCSVKIPAKYRVWRTKKKVLVTIACIWIVSVSLFFSSIFVWQMWISDHKPEPGKCYVFYLEDALFNCSLQIGYFWITLIATVALYIAIYRVALGLQRKTEAKNRRTEAVVSKSTATAGGSGGDASTVAFHSKMLDAGGCGGNDDDDGDDAVVFEERLIELQKKENDSRVMQQCITSSNTFAAVTSTTTSTTSNTSALITATTFATILSKTTSTSPATSSLVVSSNFPFPNMSNNINGINNSDVNVSNKTQYLMNDIDKCYKKCCDFVLQQQSQQQQPQRQQVQQQLLNQHSFEHSDENMQLFGNTAKNNIIVTNDGLDDDNDNRVHHFAAAAADGDADNGDNGYGEYKITKTKSINTNNATSINNKSTQQENFNNNIDGDVNNINTYNNNNNIDSNNTSNNNDNERTSLLNLNLKSHFDQYRNNFFKRCKITSTKWPTSHNIQSSYSVDFNLYQLSKSKTRYDDDSDNYDGENINKRNRNIASNNRATNLSVDNILSGSKQHEANFKVQKNILNYLEAHDDVGEVRHERSKSELKTCSDMDNIYDLRTNINHNIKNMSNNIDNTSNNIITDEKLFYDTPYLQQQQQQQQQFLQYQPIALTQQQQTSSPQHILQQQQKFMQQHQQLSTDSKMSVDLTLLKQISVQISKAAIEVVPFSRSSIRKLSTPPINDLSKKLTFKLPGVSIFKDVPSAVHGFFANALGQTQGRSNEGKDSKDRKKKDVNEYSDDSDDDDEDELFSPKGPNKKLLVTKMESSKNRSTTTATTTQSHGDKMVSNIQLLHQQQYQQHLPLINTQKSPTSKRNLFMGAKSSNNKVDTLQDSNNTVNNNNLATDTLKKSASKKSKKLKLPIKPDKSPDSNKQGISVSSSRKTSLLSVLSSQRPSSSPSSCRGSICESRDGKMSRDDAGSESEFRGRFKSMENSVMSDFGSRGSKYDLNKNFVEFELNSSMINAENNDKSIELLNVDDSSGLIVTTTMSNESDNTQNTPANAPTLTATTASSATTTPPTSSLTTKSSPMLTTSPSTMLPPMTSSTMIVSTSTTTTTATTSTSAATTTKDKSTIDTMESNRDNQEIERDRSSSPTTNHHHHLLHSPLSAPAFLPNFIKAPFFDRHNSNNSANNSGSKKFQSSASQSGVYAAQQKHKRANRARKALRTITIILGAFVVCWIPWHVLSMIMGFCPKNSVCVSPMLYDISYWLCYLNSPINPFCYALANEQFKRTFARILKFDWHRI